MMMGVWYLSQSVSFAVGGELATFAAIPEGTPHAAALGIYSHAFVNFGATSLILAIVSFMLIPYLKKLIIDPPLS
jgi:dipeptide/tripeptide permease